MAFAFLKTLVVPILTLSILSCTQIKVDDRRALPSPTPEPQTLESYVGSGPTYEELSIYPEQDYLRRLSKPIGFLEVNFGSGKRSCTAILAEDDYIVTAAHCFRSAYANEKFKSAVLYMGYYSKDGNATSYEVHNQLLAINDALDYAVVSVRGNPTELWGNASFSSRVPQAGEALLVVHHPAGLPKRVTRHQCQTAERPLEGSRLRHKCDTVKGSSGAPIFSNDGGRIVALHTAGFEPGAAISANFGVLVKDVFGDMGNSIALGTGESRKMDRATGLPANLPTGVKESVTVLPRQPDPRVAIAGSMERLGISLIAGVRNASSRVAAFC